MVVHILNPSTQEAEAGVSLKVEAIQLYIVLYQPGIPALHSEILTIFKRK